MTDNTDNANVRFPPPLIYLGFLVVGIWAGRALGLQFHAEATPESVEEISAACAGEIGPGRFEQPAAEIRAQSARCAPLRPLLFSALDALFVPSEPR